MIGAIFSLFTGVYVVYHVLSSAGPLTRRATRGFVRLTVVAISAAFLATGALLTLVGTQIKGISGIEDARESHQAGWDWATQWSLPKREILDVMLPGLRLQDGQPEAGSIGCRGRDPRGTGIFESGKKGRAPRRAKIQ